jgi:acrylyl-CoA reductase (NADPH)
MDDTFRALVVNKDEGGYRARVQDWSRDRLMEGDVLVRVAHSTVNYKDGLAVTGKGPIIRQFPMIPGIDLAGTVEESSSPEFAPGDKVVLNGYGVGERHQGGFAQYARINSEWLIPLPASLGTEQAMAIGTAGYTAMLCVMALEHNGITPDKGPILVTGANGGVGSVAITLLSGLGYQVIASTGRVQESGYLTSLGATQILDRSELSGPGKPLGKERWAGAVDSVGSQTLANVLAQTAYGGTVAACGLAQGMDLPATVAPFILRGVTLSGIDSVMAPRAKRVIAWDRLAREMDLARLAEISSMIGLDDVPEAAEAILAGKIRGRVVVDVNA